MVHRHLHKRQNHHHEDDDPFSSIENGFNSLTSAAASFFGIGGGGGTESTTAASTSSKIKDPVASDPAPVVSPTVKTTSKDDGEKTKGGGRGPSTTYVTATWTGTGTEYSLSTVVATDVPSPSPSPDPSTSISKPVPPPVSEQPSTSQTTPTTFHKSRKTSSSHSSLSAAASTSNSALPTAAAATTALSSVLSIASSSTSVSQAAASSSSAAFGVSQNSGLSGGAKAGIAIGVILGVLALIAGAFAFYRMKKNRDDGAFEHENNSEKNPFSDTAALNLGPVRAVTPPPVQSLAPAGSSNPFGTGAVPMAPTSVSHGPNGGAMAAAGGFAGAAFGATGANMTRANAPPPLNVNRAQSPALVPPPVIVPSPVGSNFSESSTLTTGGMSAGGPAGPRMHRVQMDFNPTMEDELRIIAGEIVRVVREFDDGWCSVEIVQRDGQGNVIRHQQGVVPRTCLSRLPLKPRQRRPGPGNGPASPMNNMPQSMGSQAPGRMQSPAFASNPVGRSMSPGPYGGGPQDRPQRSDTRSRSNSANDINPRPRMAGSGPSRMNPASQNSRPVELPMSQSMSALPMPAFPGHNRGESAGSTASAPVARKPVPGQFDA